jgi:hypothetical protein
MFRLISVSQPGLFPLAIRVLLRSRVNHVAVLHEDTDQVYDFDQPGMRQFAWEEYRQRNKVWVTDFCNSDDEGCLKRIQSTKESHYSNLSNCNIFLPTPLFSGKNCVGWSLFVLGIDGLDWKSPKYFFRHD